MGGFYEDVYDPRDVGEQRDEEEEAGEGPGEKCESETETETETETESESESESDVAVKKSSSYEGQWGRNGRKARVSVGGGDVVVEEEAEEKTKAKKRKRGGVKVINDSDSQRLEDHEDHIFQIAPNLNSKTSVPRSESKKLKAKKQRGLYYGRVHASIRPAHRTLFKQQLKERLAEKKKDKRGIVAKAMMVVMEDNRDIDFSEYQRFG